MDFKFAKINVNRMRSDHHQAVRNPLKFNMAALLLAYSSNICINSDLHYGPIVDEHTTYSAICLT